MGITFKSLNLEIIITKRKNLSETRLEGFAFENKRRLVLSPPKIIVVAGVLCNHIIKFQGYLSKWISY